MSVKGYHVVIVPQQLLLPETCGPSNYTPFVLDNDNPNRALWRARSPYVPPEMDSPLLLGKMDSRQICIELFGREPEMVVQSGFWFIGGQRSKDVVLRKFLASEHPPVIVDPSKDCSVWEDAGSVRNV